jgi:hypothetical protein
MLNAHSMPDAIALTQQLGTETGVRETETGNCRATWGVCPDANTLRAGLGFDALHE